MVEQERHWLPHARHAVFDLYRQQRNSAWIEARGDSMQPLIGLGTWMLVEFGAMPIGLGDIVLFALGEFLVAHRVVAWRHQQDTTFLVTKGDAEPYCDSRLRPQDVIGVVRALRYGLDGPMISVGCTGRSARVIAQISRWCGRGTGLARRTATLLPDPLRCIVLRVIPLYTRVATQVLLAPLPWVAWIQTRPASHSRKEVSNP